MKLVAKCSAFVSLSYPVHVKVCDPISLRSTGWGLQGTVAFLARHFVYSDFSLIYACLFCI